jgi:hypothetical protein
MIDKIVSHAFESNTLLLFSLLFSLCVVGLECYVAIIVLMNESYLNLDTMQ